MEIFLTVAMLIALPVIGLFGVIYYRYLEKLLRHMKATEMNAWIEMGKPTSAVDFSPSVARKIFGYLLARDYLDAQDTELHRLGRWTRLWLLVSTITSFILLLSIALIILTSR